MPSEIEWLRQVGKEFPEHYEEIRARVIAERDAATLRAAIEEGEASGVAEGDPFARVRASLGLARR
jgi:hypothetical protein